MPLLFGSSHFKRRQEDGEWPVSKELGRSRRVRDETWSGFVAGVRKLTFSLYGPAPA